MAESPHSFSLQNVGTDKVYQEPTTPRSLEACERQGIEPSELVIRERDSFKEKGATDKIVTMRHDFYEKDRARKVFDVMTEYQEILQSGLRSHGLSKEQKLEMAQQQMIKIKKREDALQEKKRAKQAKEVGQLMFVQKQALEVAEKAKIQEQAAADKEAMLEEERKKKMAERDHNAKVQAQRRKEKADGVAKELEDMVTLAKTKEEAQRRRELLEADRREEQRRAKDEAVRLKNIQLEQEKEAKAVEEENKIRARLEKMKEQELAREERVALEQEQRLRLNELKRQETQARIAATAESNKLQEKKKEEAAERRKVQAEERLKARREKELADNKIRARMDAAKAEKQDAVRCKMEEDYKAKIDELINDQQVAEARFRQKEENDKVRKQERDVARQLLLEQKQDYITRKAKIVEYKKACAKKRIQDDAEAAAEVKLQQQQLMKDMQVRRKHEKTKMDNIREQMEKMKVTKKYGYPEGFEPPPEPEEQSPTQPRPPDTARSMPVSVAPSTRSRNTVRRKQVSQVKSETANLYTHWSKEITHHTKKNSSGSKKKRRSKKSKVPDCTQTPALLKQYSPPTALQRPKQRRTASEPSSRDQKLAPHDY